MRGLPYSPCHTYWPKPTYARYFLQCVPVANNLQPTLRGLHSSKTHLLGGLTTTNLCVVHVLVNTHYMGWFMMANQS